MSELPSAPAPKTASALSTVGMPRLVKLAAASQVWGSAVGTWAVVQALTSSDSGVVWGALLALVLVYYTLAGVSALFVLRGRRGAVPYLALAQLPQLIILQTAHFQYQLLSGLYVIAKIGAFTGVEFGIMSSIALRWRTTAAGWVLGINVLAAALLWYLRSPAAQRAAEARRFPLRALDQLGGGGSDGAA